MGAVHETRQAMFWAALAAQCAGEEYGTANRIVVALLRTNTVHELCQRLQIDPAAVIAAIEDPHALSFDECERRVRQDLAERGIEFASQEHQATVQRRPLDPAVKGVFDALLEQPRQFLVSPLELLLELIRADPSLEKRLADKGLTSEALENR